MLVKVLLVLMTVLMTVGPVNADLATCKKMFDCLAMGEVDAGVEMTKTELNAMLSPSKVRFNATFHCGDDEPTYKPNDKGDDVVSDFIEDCNSCCDKFRDADTKIFNIVRKMCYTNQAGNLCTCDFVQSPASISVPISPFVPQVVGFSKSKGTKYWVPIKDGSARIFMINNNVEQVHLMWEGMK